jgi:hypothetical protein
MLSSETEALREQAMLLLRRMHGRARANIEWSARRNGEGSEKHRKTVEQVSERTAELGQMETILLSLYDQLCTTIAEADMRRSEAYHEGVRTGVRQGREEFLGSKRGIGKHGRKQTELLRDTSIIDARRKWPELY